MNANNLMAVAQPQAAPKGAKQGRMAKASGSTSKDSFDEALGRLKESAQEAGGVPKDDSPQGKDTMTDSGSARDSAPQDPLAAALAASQQGDAGKAQDTAPENMAETQETAAAVVDFSAEAKARTTDEGVPQLQVRQEQPNLQALMPQSAEAASQSKDFLAMLSGQQLPSRGEAQEQPIGRQTPLQMQLASLGQAVQQGKGQEIAPQAVQMPQNNQAAVQMPLNNQPDLQMPQSAQAMAQMPLNSQVQTSQGNQPDLQIPLSNQPQQGNEMQPALRADAPPPQDMPEVMQPRLQAEQGNRPQAAAGVQQSQAPEQQSQAPAAQAPAAQAQPQRENTLSALFGEAVVEETVREPDPLRQLHQQGMMQQGFQQNNAQSQQNLQNMLGRNAEGMAAAPTGTAGEAAEPEAVQAPQAGHEAAGALTSFRQEVQNAARTTEAPVLQQPQDDFEVPRQIVEQARLIRSGGDTEMVIHLKPEHLGDLTLKVSVSSTGAVTASFHSDNAQVRAIIENSLVQLRHDLNSQGIKVDDVEVYAGLQDEHLPQGQGQQQAWQGGQGSASGQGRNFSAEDYAEEAEDLSVLAAAAAQGGGEDNTAMEGVDYRI